MHPPADHNEPPQHDHDDSEIQRQNMIVLGFIAVLGLLSFWLVSNFNDHTKLEECMEAGHRNCVPLDTDTQNGK